jgi:vancomycin resistance protein YoaR
VLAVPVTGLALYGDPRTVEALRVDSVELPSTANPHEVLSDQAERWLDTPVTIDAGTLVRSTSRRELGATIDLQAIAARVDRLGRSGHVVADVETRLAARRGGIDEPWPVVIDGDRLRAVVEDLRTELAAASENTAPGTTAPKAPDQDAVPALRAERALPFQRSIDTLAEGLRSGRAYIRLPTQRLAAPELPAVAAEDEFAEVLASHDTDYRRVATGRRLNIEKAAQLIDGTILDPGEELSFNALVGERTLQRGFRPATEISNGQLVEGVGGGICQTAGTLHGAAFLAGLPITEHHHHSRESGYIDQGLDAMVAWPSRDLRFANDLPFRIQIRAVAREGRVAVEVRGPHRLRAVSWRTRVLERTPHREQRIPAPDLFAGSSEILEQGRDGVLLERTRVVRKPEGTTTETDRIRYSPLDRTVRVGG